MNSYQRFLYVADKFIIIKPNFHEKGKKNYFHKVPRKKK